MMMACGRWSALTCAVKAFKSAGATLAAPSRKTASRSVRSSGVSLRTILEESMAARRWNSVPKRP